MKQMTFILLQLDEACRYIKDGRLAQLRVALLLLDNAAEILLERSVGNELNWENIHERIRTKVIIIPENQRTKDLQNFAEWQPLTQKDKAAIFRFFGKKLMFLVERAKKLDARFVKPLLHLHKYRNEAYHKGKVRKETIETAAKLYLEINCELLLNLSLGGTCYASNEDYSWLENKYNAGDKIVLAGDGLFKKAVKEFRKQIKINDETVVRILGNHLESRIREVHNDLDFIVTNTGCPDKETAIHDSLTIAADIRKHYGKIKKSKDNLHPRYSLEYLDVLTSKLSEIYAARNSLEAFGIFSDIETELEPIEEDISEVAVEIDNEIQMQIDIARGK
jgi:hypothetical protein